MLTAELAAQLSVFLDKSDRRQSLHVVVDSILSHVAWSHRQCSINFGKGEELGESVDLNLLSQLKSLGYRLEHSTLPNGTHRVNIEW